jgi:hypothetical protein
MATHWKLNIQIWQFLLVFLSLDPKKSFHFFILKFFYFTFWWKFSSKKRPVNIHAQSKSGFQNILVYPIWGPHIPSFLVLFLSSLFPFSMAYSYAFLFHFLFVLFNSLWIHLSILSPLFFFPCLGHLQQFLFSFSFPLSFCSCFWSIWLWAQS